MTFRNIALATAAVSLAAAPAIAQADFARAAAPVSGDSELEGGSGVIIGVLAAAAIIAGIIIAADGDDDDGVSP